MKAWLNITCKRATELILEQEEHSLALKDRLRLWVHFYICKFCYFFYRQNKKINKAAQHLHEHQQSLSAEEKEDFLKQLQEKI